MRQMPRDSRSRSLMLSAVLYSMSTCQTVDDLGAMLKLKVFGDASHPVDLSSDDLILADKTGRVLAGRCGPADEHLGATIGNIIRSIVPFMNSTGVYVLSAQTLSSFVKDLLIRPFVFIEILDIV